MFKEAALPVSESVSGAGNGGLCLESVYQWGESERRPKVTLSLCRGGHHWNLDIWNEQRGQVTRGRGGRGGVI